MMLRKKGLAVGLLLGSTALTLPTVAHSGTPAPKFIDAIDDHGVDLTTGLPLISIEEGGIGSGAGRVAMQRIYAEGAGYVDNWTGGVYTVTTNGVVKYYVLLAGISDTFTLNSGAYVSDKGDGGTLTFDSGSNQFTYTSADGTRYTFNPGQSYNNAGNCPGADAGSCHVPLSITAPSGLKFAIGYEFRAMCQSNDCLVLHTYARLKSVTSSAGYSLQISYQTDDPGIGTEPTSAWFTRTSISFGNSANPPSPAPTIGYSYGTNTTSITDTASRTWVFTTDANGRLTGVQRPGSSSNNISYAYGADGTISSSTKDGVTNTYSRTLSGTTATETRTDPLTHQRVVTADTTLGRPTSDRNELGNTTSYAYDTNARLTRITAAEGNYVQYGYDARGNVTTTTHVAKVGSGLSNIVTSASFDATCSNVLKCNKPNSTTDANGNVTSYAYDPTHGGLTSITQPAPATGAVQPQTRYSYTQVTSASGDLVYMLTGLSACQTSASCTGSADETKVVAAYNSNLLPTSLTRENGTGTLATTSALTYDSRGNVLAVDGPLAGTGDTTALKYDSADQLTGEISADPDGGGSLPNLAVRLTYRPDGQVSKEELGTTAGQTDTAFSTMTVAETVDVTFDANSRPTQQKLSSGATAYALTQVDYDSLGRLNCTALRLNTAVYGSLPSSACTLSSQGSFGSDQVSQRLYDAAGELTDINIGVGTSVAATERHLSYTANGLVHSLLDGENNLSAYVYDGFDRLSQTLYPSIDKGAHDSDGSNYEQLIYDANGNITQRRVRSGSLIGYTYDHLNRMTHKGGSAVLDRDYTYDSLGRMLTAKFTSSAEGITNAYDALGRLTSSTSSMGGTARTLWYQYDLAGDRTQVMHQDGATFTTDYDPLGRMTAARWGITPFLSVSYDSLGRRSRIALGTSLNSSTSYGYDAISRLTSLVQSFTTNTDNETQTFAYNPASQVTAETRDNNVYAFPTSQIGTVNRPYTSNGLNQYTGAGSTSFTYDANGNLTSDGSNTYAYDAENELTSVSGAHSATLSYDPLGRLWRVSSSTGTSQFVYDPGAGGGGQVALEYNGANTMTGRFFYGPDGEPIVSDQGPLDCNNTRFLHLDIRGSMIAMNECSGARATVASYDEYGIPASTNARRIQYTGQMYLSEVGLDYYRARFYSPTLGRFMQTDPIGYADNANLYAYVSNDPVNWVDPAGLQTAPPPNGTIIVNGPKPTPDDQGAGFGGEGGGAGGGAPGGTNLLQVLLPGTPDIVVTGTQVGKPPIVTLPTPPALPNLCSSVGCIPQSTVNQIVVTGYRHHRLGGVFLNFNLLYPQEQLFVIYPDGTVIFVPTAAKNVNGEAQNKGHAPLGYVATAHTHTIDISGPGSEDFGQSLPVYFMTPNDGVFLISPGSHRAVYIGG